MSAALEGRYRAALRWYPRAWRDENADAIVGTMLDQAEADGRDAPARGEIRNLAGSAIRARLSGLEAFYPRAVRDRVALIALVLGAGASLISLVVTEWAPWAPRETVYFADGSFYVPVEPQFGPFLSGGAVLFIVWVLAFLAVLLRARAVSVVLLALTLPFSVLLYVSRPQLWAREQPQAIGMIILAGLVVLVLLGNARRPLSGRRLLLAFAGSLGVGLLGAVTGLLIGGVQIFFGRLFGGTLIAFFEARTIFAALLLLGLYAIARRSVPWGAALLLSSLPWGLLSMLYFVPLRAGFVVAPTLLALVVAFGVWRAVKRRSTTVV